jgi:integrase
MEVLTWLALVTGARRGELLADYKEHCRKAAVAAGVEFDEDGFVFSADGAGRQPWNPDTISRWFAKIAKAAGVGTTLHGLRHCQSQRLGQGKCQCW